MLRRYSAIEVEDFHELVETLEILGRERSRAGTRIAGISESGGECALLADQAEAAGIPFEPLPERLAAAAREFPNYLAPGNPLDAWAIADETEVYPRSLELLAESGEFDVLVAQADLSQFRDPTNDEWCELTLRTLARLRDEHAALFCAMTTVHSADPPRRFQELARELDVRSCAGRATRCSRSRAVARDRRSPARPGDVGPTSPTCSTARRAVRARVGARPRAPRRPVRAAAPRRDAARRPRRRMELGSPVVVKIDGPRTRPATEASCSASSPGEAAEAARRLGGPVLVARQVEPARRCSAA